MASSQSVKKPQSAYFLWFNSKREEIQKLVGAKDFKSVATKGSELWKSLAEAEKAPFESDAKRQKDAFDLFKATPEGQKALEEKKAEKQEEKKGKEEKSNEKKRVADEKHERREERAANAAVKAIDKDERLKKPLSAYFAWLNENRERITAMVGGKGGPQVTKKGAEMWKALPEKDRQPYESAAKQQKEAHDEFMKTPEGVAALKTYKDAADAVAYKKPVNAAETDEPQDEAEDETVEQPATMSATSRKRKGENNEGSDPSPRKKVNAAEKGRSGAKVAQLGA